MKKLFLIAAFGLMGLVVKAQDIFENRKNITVVTLKSGIYLEIKDYYAGGDFWLSHNSKKTLIQGMKTAVQWSDLNLSHKQSFTKEICRFQVMEKSTYKFHGYVREFSTTLKLLFDGSDSGDSSCMLVQESLGGLSPSILILNSKKEMQSFIKILSGQSANPEIDNVFK